MLYVLCIVRASCVVHERGHLARATPGEGILCMLYMRGEGTLYMLCMPEALCTSCQWGVGVSVHAVHGGGGWYDTLVCFGLQLAAPTGRSSLTALPLDPFPP